MPKKNDDDWQPDARGRYRRKVGWWINEAGKRKTYTFSFGTDKDQAKARLTRVRELWAQVVKQQNQPPEPVGFPPLPPKSPEEIGEPVWTNEAIWIGKVLAAGEVQVQVGANREVHDYVYARKVQTLARKYPFISFVPSDAEWYQSGVKFLGKAANHQLRELEQDFPNVLAGCTNIGSKTSPRWHAALDSYKADVRKKDQEPTPDGPQLTSYGAQKMANVDRIKQHQQDRPLSELDLDGCQDLLDYWRMRPKTRDKRIKPPRLMAKTTCENHVAELMRFFRWLNRSKEYEWRKPADFDELETAVKDLQEERTSVAAYTKRTCYLPTELATINKHATPLERLLLLLGLNCGLKGAEQGTLLLDHVFLDQPHPNARYLSEVSKFECRPDEHFVLYSRNKSKVYGEFLLWPQTLDLVKWAIRRRDKIVKRRGLKYRNLLITEKGTLFYRLTGGSKNRSQIFNNKWNSLIKRVRKNEEEFPYFPFSSIRDTASDLVRQVADGEVSATFLMHGKPVKEDDLIDLYTKRPFARVFEALRQLQKDLKPVFDAAPERVTEQPPQQYTPTNKRERIVELKKAGKKVSEIMEEVGVSRMTVLRTLEKLYFRISRSQ